MSSYLEAYGAAEERHARTGKIVKRVSIALGGILLVALILFAFFRNFFEERRAKNFLAELSTHNYQSAYAMWGCTEAHPCPDYSFAKFQQDWGPKSDFANPAATQIALSQSCGSGVVIQLNYKPSQDPVALWVERDSGVISFAPWVECPGRHLHFRAWLKSVFGRG